MADLRFRQIHLDFHTSEHIPDVGQEFDPERFVATLKQAHVNSVTCFSRCHHGYIYHDTKFPFRHPALKTNLLAEQIRACHAADIRVPIYITVGWDHLQAKLHPEWCERDEKGTMVGRGPLGEYGWTNLCFASEYVDFVIDQTEEVFDIFGDEADGIFYDIIFQRGVHSEAALRRFRREGWDPRDTAKQAEMRELLVTECIDRLYAAVRGKSKTAGVFFNSGHVGPAFRKRLHAFSHLEVESLPTGGWGYMHFPTTARYTRTLGKDFLGMTGKFSETWGHFQSYKNEKALEFECFQMLALGGKCSVGDQLHPRGTLDAATYDLIGAVYREIEAVEPWCKGARAVTEIAVVNAEEFDTTSERMDPRNLGALRILTEGRHQFDFVDSAADLGDYKVLILPDVIQPEGEFLAKINDFVAKGGAVIASGTAGLTLSDFPVVANGPLTHSPDFLRITADLGLRTDTDYIMYERGQSVTADPESEVLATITEPYFSRTWDHFVSHAHTPAATVTNQPGLVQRERVIYFAHPVFTTYAKHSMSFHRDLVLAALRRLLPEPLVEIPGPTSLQATLTKQESRIILHLLHYIPERRGLHFDIVEDAMPVAASEAIVRVPGTTAYVVPTHEAIPVTRRDDGLHLSLPAFTGRLMVAIE